MKYKFSILFLIIAVVMLFPIREGFVGGLIGEYDYLKPLPSTTILDSTTESNFVLAFNNVNKSYSKIKADEQSMRQLKNNATQEEFEYYIKNNKWPYGSYISNYIKDNLPRISSVAANTFSPDTPTVDLIQQAFPTRMAYMMFAQAQEIKQSPKPQSNDIYMGVQTSSTVPTSMPTASSNPVASESASSLSGDNYQKLQSICSSLK